MPASKAFYPGPYELRLLYNTAGRDHIARYNLKMYTDATPPFNFSAVQLLAKDGSHVYLDVAVDAWVVLMKAIYNSGNSAITAAELWKYEVDSFIAAFQSSYSIGVAGTSGSSYHPAGQSVLTFRTEDGHRMRLDFMESIYATGASLSYAGAPAAVQAIIDFVLSAGNWILARDGSYPQSFHRLHNGENEALFRRIYRP
jgi:hypothetical protein